MDSFAAAPIMEVVVSDLAGAAMPPAFTCAYAFRTTEKTKRKKRRRERGGSPWRAAKPNAAGVYWPVGDAAVNGKKCKTAGAMILGGLPEDVLLQVATKLTAREVWDSLKVRFIGANRVRAARLATLRGEFDRLKMADGEALDAYVGRLGAMTARYASLGETLGDAALVKKLLDTVPDRVFLVVAGIEQFYNVDEALGRLRAFDERTRRRGQDSGEREGDQLLLTMAQWRAREREQGDDDCGSVASGNGDNRCGRCYKCGERGHFKRECPQLRKEPAAERALLTDTGVEDDGLL
ncbi:uncharacterized protein [Aegilops tauschii subsp. strangulata]|uniref:uncharacterized protein n=1 Tax=Aegilops tauschii subsp. strangulata TaxID=200361 RepID=UPI003CC881B4